MASQWKQAAAALVDAVVPPTRDCLRRGLCTVLLPHARAALDLTSSGMSKIAQYLGRSGSYPAITSPPGRAMRGMWPVPVTSSPPCCPSKNGSWARPPRHPRLGIVDADHADPGRDLILDLEPNLPAAQPNAEKTPQPA